MRILGIYDDHNAGCAIIEDGKILAAIEEERLSRIKLHNGTTDGMPINSLIKTLEMTNSTADDIDKVAIAMMKPWDLLKYTLKDLFGTQKNIKWILASLFSKSVRWDRYWLFYPYFYNKIRIYNIKKMLKKVGLQNKPIEYVDHHRAHAASAYFTSGKNRALIVTIDGQGDSHCGQVWLGENGRMKHLHTEPSYHSPGLFYNFITWYQGFKPMRHEGKITGLAAYGRYEHAKQYFEKLFGYDGTGFRYYLAEQHYQHAYPHRTNYVKFKKSLPKGFEKMSLEDVAAGVQVLTENVVSEFIKKFVDKMGPIDVCLAGGVFANVRVNQKIAELQNTKSVYIFPAMGDNGLPVGAALYAYYKSMNWPQVKNIPQITDVYLGPEFSNEEIEAVLKKSALKYDKVDNIAKKVAELLHKGHVVARFDGRMEFGPRALGNRSILYSPIDITVNDWLNHKLKRTEFMPFAPVTILEDMNGNYKNVGENDFPARFMTITFDCSDEMKETCPAVVHVDQTARPQLIDENVNPIYYQILKEYKKLSGLSSIINTSFNMHEEPIVCTPQDAIRAFKLGHLEYLAISDFLVYSPNPEKAAKKE